jgi:type IV pilus assembly protein PilC
MAQFAWKGIQHQALAEGVLEAAHIDDAKRLLKEMKVILTELKQVGEAAKTKVKLPKELKTYQPRKITNQMRVTFTKKFSTMVEAGLPMLKTLSMLEDQSENPHMKKLMNTIRTDVESGSTLADAFTKHPAVFDTVYINLLRAGETSGKLTFFLQRLCLQLEKSEKIRAKVKSAMMYPLILLVVAFCVILIMLIKVVPVFEQMFRSMGHDLPAITKLIVSISEFCRAPSQGGVVFVLIVGSIVGFRYTLKKNSNIRRKFHALCLRVPLMKDIILKSTLAKVAMIQGNLSAAGVPVLAALQIVRDAVTNMLYQDALMQVRRGVEEGTPLSRLYENTPQLFPPTFTQMIAVGEETGNMDEMFASIMRFYEEEFDQVVDRLTEMLEPIMIVFMGITIGFLILAMYMPIFQMGNAIMK